jgi:hypothetical protein
MGARDVALRRRRSGATLAVVIALTWASASPAENRLALEGPTRGAAMTNYGDLLNGAISIEVEPRIAGWLSLQVGVGLKGFPGVLDARAAWPTFGLAEVGARFYPLGRAPSGFWFGPTARGLAFITKDLGPPPRALGWALGGAAGYHLVLAPRFLAQFALAGSVADFGAGPVFEPRLRLGLGFIF